METFKSDLSEVEQLRQKVETLERLADLQDERHRFAIMAAENLLTFLRKLYGDIV